MHEMKNPNLVTYPLFHKLLIEYIEAHVGHAPYKGKWMFVLEIKNILGILIAINIFRQEVKFLCQDVIKKDSNTIYIAMKSWDTWLNFSY